MPRSVAIGPYDVPVNELTAEDSHKDFGQFHSASMEIRMHETFPSDQQAAETLIHEIMHALLYVYGVKIKDEEHTVAVVSTALATLIKLNPDLISYLQDALSNDKRAVKK